MAQSLPPPTPGRIGGVRTCIPRIGSGGYPASRAGHAPPLGGTSGSPSALTVEGKDVPAGNYTIFTIPDKDKWTLIINKHTGEWGIPYKYESEELARVPMSVSATSGPVENFTIAFDQSGSACALQLSWENTQASVKFTEKK